MREECENYMDIMDDLHTEREEIDSHLIPQSRISGLSNSNTEMIEKEISFFIDNLRKVLNFKTSIIFLIFNRKLLRLEYQKRICSL